MVKFGVFESVFNGERDAVCVMIIFSGLCFFYVINDVLLCFCEVK